MASDVVLRYRSEGAGQAAAEARGLGKALDGLKNRRFEVQTTGALAALDRLGNRADVVSKRMTAIGSSASRHLTLPIVGAAALSVKAFSDFDGAMTKSLAVMGKVGPALRKQMEQVARSTSKELGFSAKETAAGFLYLGASGLTAQQSMKALPLVAKTARAGLMDLESATTLLLDSQSALGLKSKDAGKNLANLTRVSDVFARSADVSNMSIQQMGEAITNKAGAALRFVKKPLAEGAAALAYMADQGTKGATAGEYLSIGLRDIARAAAANKEAFAKQNISVLDAKGNLKSLPEIADEFTRATKDMGDAQKYQMLDQLGLTRSVGDFIRSINGGGKAMRNYQAQIESAGGYTERVAGKQMQAFGMRMEQVRARVMDTALSLGEVLAPGVLSAADAMASLAEGLRGLPAGAQKAIGVAAALAAAFGPVALLAGGITRGVGGMARAAASVGRAAGYGAAASTGASLGPAGALGARAGTVPVYVTNMGAGGLAGPGGGPMPGGAARAPYGRGFTGNGGYRFGDMPYPGATTRASRIGGFLGPGTYTAGSLSRFAARGGVGLGAGLMAGGATYGIASAAGAPSGVSTVLGTTVGGAAMGASMGGVPGAFAGALAGAAVGGLTLAFQKFGGSDSPVEAGVKAGKKFTDGLRQSANAEQNAQAVSDASAAVGRARQKVIGNRTGMAVTPGGTERAQQELVIAQQKLGQAAGKALSDSLKAGPQVRTARNVTKEMVRSLGKLEPDARAVAAKAGIAQVREMEKSGRLQKGEADKVVRNLTNRFGDLKTTLPASAKKAAAQFTAGLKMDKAVAAAGRTMKSVGAKFDDFPKQAKTTTANVRTQYQQTMAFLEKKLSDPKATKAQVRLATDMQGKVKAQFGKVEGAGKKLDAAYSSTGSAAQAAGAAGASGANQLASGWESAAARTESSSARIRAAVASANSAKASGGGINIPGLGKVGGGSAAGGRVPGKYTGRDTTLWAVAGDEVVLTPTQQSMVPGGRALLDNVLRATGGSVGGRSFAKGGAAELTPRQKLLASLKSAGITGSLATSIAVRIEGADTDYASAVTSRTGGYRVSTAPSVASMVAGNKLARVSGLSADAITAAREGAANQAEIRGLKKDKRVLEAGITKLRRKLTQLAKDEKAIAKQKNRSKRKAAYRAVAAARAKLRLQLEQLEDARAQTVVRLDELGDAQSAAITDAAPPASGVGTETPDTPGNAIGTMLTDAARDDSLQDKQARKAGEDQAKSEGITNSELISARGELAAMNRRRDEVRQLAAAVKSAYDQVVARIAFLWGEWGKEYDYLRKTKATQVVVRAKIKDAIQGINDQLDYLRGDKEGLWAQYQDLAAQAAELDFDIGELQQQVEGMPKVASDSGSTDSTSSAATAKAEAERDAARRSLGYSEAFLRTGFGVGDIGTGAPTGYQAAGGVVNAQAAQVVIQTLIPQDPRTLEVVAAGISAAMSSQAPRLSNTVRSGL